VLKSYEPGTKIAFLSNRKEYTAEVMRQLKNNRIVVYCEALGCVPDKPGTKFPSGIVVNLEDVVRVI